MDLDLSNNAMVETENEINDEYDESTISNNGELIKFYFEIPLIDQH